ncbi:unnamed protein product [Candida verbasci]|uniref:N-terminal acetyltransferase A complex subunit NAT1 n=1 Tax=Candida verbasci TaxID=1227364 RepID=A0A9W4TZM9_9ASCO|nr:unnamed protein product [Candida verbasci]
MVVGKKGIPIISNKEDANFREALKLFDSKQYKKALKLIDLNLKKNSNHAESLALKGNLILNLPANGENKESDSLSYINKAIAKDSSNYLVDHLIGIYYRSKENYFEASKWLKLSLDNGSPNKAILRDLSFMQVHLRDYKSLKESRQIYLEHQPGYRANWTGLAIAQYLNNELTNSINTLSKIEDIITPHLNASDLYEHNECTLFKNKIYGELKDYSKALEVLEGDESKILDKLSYLEYRAKYLLMMDDKKSASKIYRALIKRNPDNVAYYNLLELSLDTINKPVETRVKLYEKLSNFYPKSDPPKFLPLTFIPSTNPIFETKVKEYLIPQLIKGVPALFVNVKPLYKNQSKSEIIEKVVLEFVDNELPNIQNPTVSVWTNYYLSQHYLYKKELIKAMEYINIAITHSPTLVELYIIKSRILKHENKIAEAMEVMNEGRELDLQDRFINSKATKYMLRNNCVNEAIDTISLFTKLDEGTINGCKDLHIMQVNWILIESGEAYNRLYSHYKLQLESQENDTDKEEIQELVEIYKGLSLKRFQSVLKNFEIFYADQYDFHSYCMRRGTPRDYIDLIKWEDKIHSTPVYIRALKGLTNLYFELYEEQKGTPPTDDDIQVKKINKKQKKAQVQANKKRQEFATRVESEKDDSDPFGINLINNLLSDDILTKLYELYKPLIVEGKDLLLTWESLFKIYLYQGKYVLALSAIKNFHKLLNNNGTTTTTTKHCKIISNMLIALSDTLNSDIDVNPAIKKVVEKGIISSYPDFEK